ncbi:site-specific integrase [Frankia sp. CiP3]|uniref:tyrosine-type recombinase/integrase n=1 Tax=Frankia sp. CiP3 TaxID=2880971 RepID=UPI001EF5F6FC|nr:site-specific integrase [Frankia sp. CiP3]
MKRRRYGTIRKLPSGRWQARMPGPDGTLVPLGTFTTKREADQVLAAAETDQARGMWTDPKAGQQNFGAFTTHWMRTRTLRPMTRQLYDRQLRLRILPTFGALTVGAITPKLVREWYARLMRDATQQGLGTVTVDTTYRLLRAILTTAVEDDLITKNPCRIKGAGTVRETHRPDITVEQLWRLADTVPERYRVLVWLASATALRSGELAALRRKNVDVIRREIRIDPDKGQYVEPGGGQKPYFGPPKSDAGVRTVPIPDIILGIVAVHMAHHAQPGPDGLIFTTKDGNPVSRHNRSWWRRACRLVGVDEGTHLHDCRHAGLTLAAQSGATLRELMVLGGHSTPRAALIYQKASRDRATEVARGMSTRLATGSTRRLGA